MANQKTTPKQRLLKKLEEKKQEWINLLEEQGENWEQKEQQEGEIDGLQTAIEIIKSTKF